MIKAKRSKSKYYFQQLNNVEIEKNLQLIEYMQ